MAGKGRAMIGRAGRSRAPRALDAAPCRLESERAERLLGIAARPAQQRGGTIKIRRVGTKDCSPVPLTEPDVRFTHPAPWIAMSDFQRELVRDLRRVEVVPQGFERGHPAGEPARWVSSRHRRAV